MYAAAGAPWEVGVLPGPNAEPDYFTHADIDTFYSATYNVHYNSWDLLPASFFPL